MAFTITDDPITPAAPVAVEAPKGGYVISDSPSAPNDRQGVRDYVARKEREAVTPTGSFLDNLSAGFGRGFDRAALGLEDITKSLGHRVTVGGNPLVTDQQLADVKARIDAANQTDKPLMHTWGGTGGDIGFNLLETAGVPMGGLKSQMAVGGTLGALQPVGTGESRLANTAMGAGGALAGNLLARGAARVISPNTAPEVKSLLDQGVSLTPGQVLGGAAKATEDKLTSVPLLGDFIKNAQGRSIEDFNRAAYNRALAPIGENAGKDFPVGREGMSIVKQKLGAAYDALLPKLSFKADQQFGQDVANLRNLAGAGTGTSLGAAEAKQFEDILKNTVIRRMTPQGNMSGDVVKIVESDLGRLAKGYASDPSFDKRQLGSAIAQLQASVRDNLMRSNPAEAKTLQAINEGYANFTRLRRAASSTGTDMGLFTPAQLAAAVKAADTSVGKGNTAIGEALMQDLSDAGKRVLPSKIPDSGTAGRGMLGAVVAGGAGAFAHPAVPAAIALGAGAYTRPGTAALSALLSQRPAIAQPISELLRQSAPYAAIGGAAALPLLRQ